jgi:hypothetical protein
MGVETKTGSGEIATFDGQKLTNPIPYTFEYKEYGSKDDAASVWPNDNDILVGINTDAERNAKAAAYQAKTKVFREVKENTLDAVRERFIQSGIDGGRTREDMVTLASQIIQATDKTKAADARLAALLAGQPDPGDGTSAA